ncbi:hypothetical protein WR25_21806 [Diploscapter pachys]|uniref:Uncharacterized protein n=1 Tax=Diploscapter pachys TaxID=2018661 RepID=A0A2A2L7H6_9BILA|nr:hypothetical protein WR25_21806 [Diploscapter pachys]
MEMELNRALKRGLPFPILKVIEYLSYDGFVWGRQYRLAGYYTACMLKGLDILLFTTLDDHSIPNQEFNGHTSTTFYTVNLFPCYSTSCFEIPTSLAILCIIFGGMLWLAEAKCFYALETLFSARRNKSGSVLDRQKASSVDFAEQNSIDSYETRFTLSTSSRTSSTNS